MKFRGKDAAHKLECDEAYYRFSPKDNVAQGKRSVGGGLQLYRKSGYVVSANTLQQHRPLPVKNVVLSPRVLSRSFRSNTILLLTTDALPRPVSSPNPRARIKPRSDLLPIPTWPWELFFFQVRATRSMFDSNVAG